MGMPLAFIVVEREGNVSDSAGRSERARWRTLVEGVGDGRVVDER